MAARHSNRGERNADPEFEVEMAGGGVMSRIAERIIVNPAMSGGLLVMALTTAAVVSNAMFLQKVQHPQPWFMTRPAMPEMPADAAEPAKRDVPTPRPRAEAHVAPSASAELAPADLTLDDAAPTPATSSALEQYPPAESGPAPAPDTAVIVALQRELAERGLYNGEVDGISGSRTEAAITAYQQARGLPVTGKPSAEVLDDIRTASIDPAQAAAEPVTPPVAATKAAKALEPQPVVAVTAEPLDAASSADSDPLASEIEIARRNRYLSVQRALNRIGYGPVAEDGRADDDTENAIRRFELDNGLPITGTPEDAVIERLVSIGAMEAT